MNMHDVVSVLYREVSYSLSHHQILGMDRIAAPLCFPDPFERGRAYFIFLNAIRYCINAPPSFLKVPRKGKKKPTNRCRDRCGKKKARRRACVVTVPVSPHSGMQEVPA
jgi:hypothetical protein